jgi:membrane protease YdiL (CAAX protease family)
MTQVAEDRAGETMDRSLAIWEVVSVTTSFLIAEWVVLVFVGRSKVAAAIPVTLAFLFLCYSHRLRGETLHAIGLRKDNLAAALRQLLLPTLVAGMAILFAGWMSGGLRFELITARPRFLLLPLWALAQQYVLQGFVNRRARIALGAGVRSVVVVATMFALLHLPNVPLSAATFLGGLVWAWVYQRTPNLLAPAISHSVLSLLLAFSLPPAWLNSLRVGFKYFG